MNSGLIMVGAALCFLAEDADARVLEEIIDTRDDALRREIPSISESLKQLALRADTEQKAISLSLEKDDEAEKFIELGLHSLSEEERDMLTKLYALEGRTIIFLSESIVVYPYQQGIQEQFTDMGDDAIRREFPLLADTLKLLALQSDNGRKSISLPLTDGEMSTDFGLGALSEEEKKRVSDLFALEGRTVTFLSESIVMHPHQRIEEALKARFSGEGGFYLRLGPPRKKSLETVKN